ncbi:MAG: TIGR01777 family protein [Bacteroidetes bacterium]|nr:TIGR01777 family protein [Bacteroidota bacterium]
MKKKVLITGATGLIGQKLIELCSEKGIEVHYFTRDPSKVSHFKNAKGFLWDIKNRTLDDGAFQGVTTIVHLAGAPISKRWTKSYRKTLVNSRVVPMQMMYERLEKINHSVGHFISASGISIYPSSSTKLYTEDEQSRSLNFITEVVEKWEAQARKFKSLGMEVSKVRTGLVLAKNGGLLQTLVQPVRLGIGSPLGSGEQWQSWIHIEDIAGIYLFLMRSNMEGIFNAVAPNPVKQKRLIKLIATKLNKPLWMPNVPGFAIKLLMGEMGSLALESQLVSANKIKEIGYHFQYPNLEPALDDLL